VHLGRLDRRDALEGIQRGADRLRVDVAHQLADVLQLAALGLVGGEALVVLDGVAQVFVDGHLGEALLAEFGQLGPRSCSALLARFSADLLGPVVFFVVVVFVLGHLGAGRLGKG
jgi:hypothetical protein